MANLKKRQLNEELGAMVESLEDDNDDVTSLEKRPRIVEVLSDELIVEGYEVPNNEIAGKDIQSSPIIQEEEDLRLLLESWNVPGLLEKLKGCGISYDNLKYLEDSEYSLLMQGDPSLIGQLVVFRHHHRQWKKRDLCSEASDHNETVEKNFSDIKKVLNNGGKDGADILRFFESNRFLTDELRETLIRLIITQFNPLSREKQRDFTAQICALFPGEKQHYYYKDPPPGQKNPTGLLYRRYNQMRAKKPPSKDVENEELSDDERLQNLLDDAKDSLEYLNDDTDYELITEHWSSTFELRKLKMKKYGNAIEAIKDWLPLQKIDGYLLIHFDFAQKYGDEFANSLKKNWDQFFFRAAHDIAQGIKEPTARKSFLKGQTADDENLKNRALVMALHNYHYLAPSPHTVNNRRFTPPIQESKDTFINLVSNANQIDKIMNDFEGKNIKPHPIIFEIQNIRELSYIVAVGTWRYECDSLIDAVDACCKIFDVFQIPYPPECGKVWMFLIGIFFEDSQGEKLTDKLSSLIDTFKRFNKNS